MDISAQGDDNIFRASEIDKATDCARKLGYSRLGFIPHDGDRFEAIPPTTSMALLGGSAVDDALSEAARRSMVGQSLTGSDLLWWFDSSLRNMVAKAVEEKVKIEDHDLLNETVNEGRALLSLYDREYAPKFNITAVQKDVSVDIPISATESVTLVGHIDYTRQTSAGKVIGDWKFTKKSANQMTAQGYVRGHAYDLMDGDGTGQTELVLLRRGLKTPKIETSSYFVTKGDHAAVRKQVSTLARMYRMRVFPMASPANWACSKDWCQFWAICRGHPKGPTKIPGEE